MVNPIQYANRFRPVYSSNNLTKLRYWGFYCEYPTVHGKEVHRISLSGQSYFKFAVMYMPLIKL